jgi:hypothetical protein
VHVPLNVIVPVGVTVVPPLAAASAAVLAWVICNTADSVCCSVIPSMLVLPVMFVPRSVPGSWEIMTVESERSSTPLFPNWLLSGGAVAAPGPRCPGEQGLISADAAHTSCPRELTPLGYSSRLSPC